MVVAQMKDLPHTHGCFVCGDSNTLGLNLRFHDDGTEVYSTFTPSVEHIGFRNVVHGGLLSTVLDEIMVWACVARTRRFAFCAEMTVRFLRPVAPGTELSVVGRLTEDRRGRIFLASGELADAEGVVCASATGKYMPIPEEDAQAMSEDLVGEM